MLNYESIDRGRSIHLLFKFEYKKYLSPRLRKIDLSSKSWDMNKTLWLNRMARKIFLRRIVPDTNYKRVIDWGTALDARRVVPMINSRNVIMRRWITVIDPEELRLNSEYIWNKAAKSINLRFEELTDNN